MNIRKIFLNIFREKNNVVKTNRNIYQLFSQIIVLDFYFFLVEQV